jgi:hypothetical protein
MSDDKHLIDDLEERSLDERESTVITSLVTESL